MSQQDFRKAFTLLIENEKGYVNHPEDPGGETNWGISKKSYPDLDIKNLTVEQARDIYYQDYWLVCNCDLFQYALAFEVLDAAVNHGTTKAIMLVQQAAGVADDGELGPITVAAIKATSPEDMLLRFQGYRLRFLTKLKKWDTFGRGWANRVADNLIRDAANN